MATTKVRIACLCACLAVHVYFTTGQYLPPVCPDDVGGYVLLPHLAERCYFYACYAGSLLDPAPYQCPEDPEYYALLQESGIQNPCSECFVPATDSPTTAAPPATTTPPTTTPPSTKPPTTAPPTTNPPTTAPPPSEPSPTPTESIPEQPTIKEIMLIAAGAHGQGGQWAGDDTTLRQCLQLCEQTESCVGFDFDRTYDSCWVHTVESECSVLQPKDNCTHFRLYPDCPTTTVSPVTDSPGGNTGDLTTVAPPQTPVEPFMGNFTGKHMFGGTQVPLAGDLAIVEACIAICRLDSGCYGADFDTGSSSCWIHSLDTMCDELFDWENCTHYRLEDVCENTPTTDVTDPTTTPSVGDPDDDGGSTGLDGVPNGYVEAVEGFHITGGLRMFVGVTLQQCLDACLVTPYCLALDYDAIEKGCYFHFRNTYCKVAYELPGNIHLKRVPCIDGVANDAAATWFHFHAEGAAEVCTDCPLGVCLDLCYSDPECGGIDYDIRNHGCYLFRPGDVCGPLIPKDYCVHISRDVCVPDAFNAVTIDSLAMMVYPPPSSVPAGWQVYPGIRIRHGIQVGAFDSDPDACVDRCASTATCRAGDYNTADGSCWLHLATDRQCAQVEVSDVVYHFKKEGCDYVYGTLEPYLSPVRIAT